MNRRIIDFIIVVCALTLTSCSIQTEKEISEMDEIRIMTLDPGHFHAALVQKNMYDQVSPDVYVFAPSGQDLKDHLGRIEGFNSRPDSPTSWNMKVYAGEDYFEQMIAKRPGNVVVLSGNNRKKIDYILKSVESGINVLADKPMVISPEYFSILEQAFELAYKNGILLYDIMTERFEITTMLQKTLSQNPDIFGTLQSGSPDEPAVTKESTHHFFKYVSDYPLKRPAWFFDTKQQGEGIVDVTTHLVDLIQWECFPEEALSKSDVELVSSKRWPTIMSPDDFLKVTGKLDYPEFLTENIIDGNLHVYANGEINYKLKDVYARVRVEWKYRAPEGAGDTHYSIMKGTKCKLIIKQDQDEGYKPILYLELIENDGSFQQVLDNTLRNLPWEGISAEKTGGLTWKLIVPDKYRVGHEAHFVQVTQKYLDYLKEGGLPEWEVPNMIVKYYTITEALKLAIEF